MTDGLFWPANRSGAGALVTLREFGVSKKQIEEIVVGGLQVARLTKAYPVQPAASSYRQIVNNAYEGVLSDSSMFARRDEIEERADGTVASAL